MAVSGIDWLDGEGGNDTILGGDLGDVIIGGPGNDTLVGELGRDTISGDDGDDVIFTHLNNDIRVALGLDPVAELTSAERQSRRAQLEADLAVIEPEWYYLDQIENRTAEQQLRYEFLSDTKAVIYLSLTDLLEYQSVYIDQADGGANDDTIYGSPNIDILLGGEGNDDIHASGGYRVTDDQGDIIKGEGG